jgi:hypothetical protein
MGETIEFLVFMELVEKEFPLLTNTNLAKKKDETKKTLTMTLLAYFIVLLYLIGLTRLCLVVRMNTCHSLLQLLLIISTLLSIENTANCHRYV